MQVQIQAADDMAAATVQHTPSAFLRKSEVDSLIRADLLPQDSELDLEAQEARTIDELIKLRARQVGNNEPVISYPNEGTEYIGYTPKDLDLLVERVACQYVTVIPRRRSSDDPVQVIGLPGDSDLNYLISLLAVSRLGHTVLLLSTRITDEAYESLLLTTKATALIHQTSFSAAASGVRSKLPDLWTLQIADIRLLKEESWTLPPAFLDPYRETENGSFIIHSSGSTGLPKPIYQTHSASLYTYSQHFGLIGHLTLPLYHNHGICCTFRAINSRKKVYLYNARLPLTSQHLLSTLREHPKIRILYGVPYALKLLAETEEGTCLLSCLDIVMFGGSACPKPIGDSLVNSGVYLVGHYGATEVGQLMTSFRDFNSDKLWDWLRVPRRLLPHLSMGPRGPNLFELCVKEGWASKVATNRDDGSYATKDLFEPHPTLANTWRYYARLDDTMILENGEKANPLLAEGVLRQNRNVAEAVVFGAGKPRLGAFIIPKPDLKLSKEEIVDSVMPAIEEMNTNSAAYSKLSRDMIWTLPAESDYRRTAKGTVIRAAFYRDFGKHVNNAYMDRQEGTLRLPEDDLLAFLRTELASNMKQDTVFSNNTDLFSLGLDSLQAIQLRSAIVKTLDLGGKELGRNFVFDFPTLNRMAKEVLRLQQGGTEEAVASIEERMAAMIERYSDFEQHRPVDRVPDGRYIVVTGATGSLSAHVIARLALQNDVRKSYCLIRAADQASAASRVSA